MAKMIIRTLARTKRRYRTRNKMIGTPERPRLSVYRSQKNIFAQIVDDTKGLTLSAASTLVEDFKTQAKGDVKPLDAARIVGKILAARAKEKNVDKIVFDKSGYQYHGRVKALAEGAREGGLQF